MKAGRVTVKKVLILLTALHSFFNILFFTYKAFSAQSNLLYNFIALTIPLDLVISIFFLVIWLIKDFRFAFIPLATLLCGITSIKETFNFSYKTGRKPCDVSIMSYNVGTFKLDRFSFSIDKDSVIYVDTTDTYEQNKWLENVETDVICFQEFYNNDNFVSESIINHMVKKGYTYYYTNPIVQKCFAGFFGVITFSRFPIIHADSIGYAEPSSLNRGVYTDIVKGKDTIRVINIHLHSMSIRINQSGNINTLQDEIEVTKNKLHKGFIVRSKQIEKVLQIVDASPYPVILCGDFNDTPHSFVYHLVRKKMENAFEEAGTGFGLTYNKAPFFVRIDNQFYDRRLKAVYYETLINHKSDHFPIEAGYIFR